MIKELISNCFFQNYKQIPGGPVLIQPGDALVSIPKGGVLINANYNKRPNIYFCAYIYLVLNRSLIPI